MIARLGIDQVGDVALSHTAIVDNVSQSGFLSVVPVSRPAAVGQESVETQVGLKLKHLSRFGTRSLCPYLSKTSA